MAAKKKATAKKTTKQTTSAKQPKKAKAAGKDRMSALDAAAKVLAEAGEPMKCKELIERMAERGYWKSPAGKTPAATLYSALLKELQTKGKDARFKKVDRGRFALK